MTSVLVVDDHPDAAMIMCTMLRALGYQANAVTSGQAVLPMVSHDTPNAVLLDIGLPDMSGYEIAHSIREKYGDSIALIAVTGWGEEADRARALAAGFDRFFIKPASCDEIRGAIDELVLRN